MEYGIWNIGKNKSKDFKCFDIKNENLNDNIIGNFNSLKKLIKILF